MLIEVKVPQLSEIRFRRPRWSAGTRRKATLFPAMKPHRHRDRQVVVLETPAPADGVLVKIVKQGGDSVTSG